jgi:hypothetical protein
LQASHFQIAFFRSGMETPMRAFNYVAVLVLVLTSSTMAGSADRGLPGVGTFVYCGSPILISVPALMAAR